MQQETAPQRRRNAPGRRLAAVVAATLALVALLFVATRPLGGGNGQPSFYVIGSSMPGMRVGQIAPGSAQASGSSPLPLTDLDGARTDLAAFGGRPIWIIFWKTACEPCEAEAPDVAAAYAMHRKDGLVVIGIDLWDSAAAVRDYATSHKLSFPIALDRTSGFMTAYGVWGAPTHYFINAAGIIEGRNFGPMTRDLIEASLRRII